MQPLPYLPDVLRYLLLCVAGDYHTYNDCCDYIVTEEKGKSGGSGYRAIDDAEVGGKINRCTVGFPARYTLLCK